MCLLNEAVSFFIFISPDSNANTKPWHQYISLSSNVCVAMRGQTGTVYVPNAYHTFNYACVVHYGIFHIIYILAELENWNIYKQEHRLVGQYTRKGSPRMSTG